MNFVESGQVKMKKNVDQKILNNQGLDKWQLVYFRIQNVYINCLMLPIPSLTEQSCLERTLVNMNWMSIALF